MKSKKDYFPALTGVRAIAAYLVFIHHFNPFAEAQYGHTIHNFTRHGAGFLAWDEIYNDRIARVGFANTDGNGITWNSACDYFRFESHTEQYGIPVSSLSTSAWELDLLLYIYRGRFEQKNMKPAASAGLTDLLSRSDL